MRLIGIINEHAGNYSRREVEQYQELLKDSSHDGEIFTVSCLDDTEYIIKNNPANIYCIGGGDGTISRTMTLLNKHSDCRTVAPLSLGTMNNLAQYYDLHDGALDLIRRRLRLKPSSQQFFEQLCNNDFNARPIRPLKINDDIGFNVGTGIVHDLLYNFNKSKEFYPLRVLRTIKESLQDPGHRDMIHLGERVSDEYTGFYAAVYPNASIGLKSMQVKMLGGNTSKVDLSATRLSRLQLLLNAPRTLFTLLPNTDYVHTDYIEIKHSVQYQVDGDTYEADTLYVERSEPYTILTK